jgi:hypothetical protein
MTVGPIRPTLLSQSYSWRRNSIPVQRAFGPTPTPRRERTSGLGDSHFGGERIGQ